MYGNSAFWTSNVQVILNTEFWATRFYILSLGPKNSFKTIISCNNIKLNYPHLKQRPIFRVKAPLTSQLTQKNRHTVFKTKRRRKRKCDRSDFESSVLIRARRDQRRLPANYRAACAQRNAPVWITFSLFGA